MNVGSAQAPETANVESASVAAVREIRDLFDAGNLTDALDSCERMLARQPGSAEALLLLGLISYELEETHTAITLLLKAHEMAPGVREYADALACIYAHLGNDADALFYAKLAAIAPAHPMGSVLLPERYSKFFNSLSTARPHRYRDRAESLLAKGDAAGAFEACNKQLEFAADDVDTIRLLARAALCAGKIGRAVAAIDRLNPDDLMPADYDLLAQAMAKAGRFADAEKAHAMAIAAAPADSVFAQSRIRTLATQYGSTGGHLERANQAWVSRHVATTGAQRIDRPAKVDPARPLRIGYVGGGLHAGPLADLLTPILAAHDPLRVQAYCYAANDRYDTASETIARSIARWTNINGIDPATVAEILRNDQIDLAVDLTGHGTGSQLLAFAHHPAPVCVSWLGSALPAGFGFDYLLASEVLLPTGEEPRGPARSVFRLPTSHLAYRPADAPDAIAELPAKQTSQVTIGILAPLEELPASSAKDWAMVLEAVDGARLLIANRDRLEGQAVRRFYDIADAAGVRDRIDIAELEACDPAGYGFFEYFDVLLDPQPNSQFLETCRSLWMGVPVLALAGTGYSGRQAAAALIAAGRAEWVYTSAQERAAGLRELVSDLDRLADLRANLRQELAASALCDVTGFTRELEAAYQAMAKL